MNTLYGWHYLIKYHILRWMGKKPIELWEAEEDDEIVPGLGYYLSDGIYENTYDHYKARGFTPMWKRC
jgi:hypothetical protein